MTRLIFRIDIHLTLFAIKFQAETTPITKSQTDRLAPTGLLASMPDTIPQRIAQTVTTLHEQRLARLLQLIGWRHIGQPTGCIEGTGLPIGNII